MVFQRGKNDLRPIYLTGQFVIVHRLLLESTVVHCSRVKLQKKKIRPDTISRLFIYIFFLRHVHNIFVLFMIIGSDLRSSDKSIVVNQVS